MSSNFQWPKHVGYEPIRSYERLISYLVFTIAKCATISDPYRNWTCKRRPSVDLQTHSMCWIIDFRVQRWLGYRHFHHSLHRICPCLLNVSGKWGHPGPSSSSLSHPCCSLICLYQADSILGKVARGVVLPSGDTFCIPQPAHQSEPSQVQPCGCGAG